MPTEGIYERYKHDTDSVAGWLASTAKANGYTPPSKPDPKLSEQESKPGNRQARREAERKAKKAAKDYPTAAPKKYIIAIKEFLPLAQFIAAHKPAVRIPVAFSRTLDRVIKLRSQFSAQIRGHSKDLDTTESDATHSYFLGILKSVDETLHPLYAAVVRPSRNQVEDPQLPLSNAFAGLEIHEPSQEFLDAPDIERPKPAASDNVQYEAESLQDDYENLVKYICIAKDVESLRLQIKRTWRLYATGALDLAATAVATNTAIELARSLTDTANRDLMSTKKGLHFTAKNFHNMCCLRRGSTPEELRERHGQSHNFNAELHYDIAECDYWLSHAFLMQFENIVDGLSIDNVRKHIPVNKLVSMDLLEGAIPVPDLTRDRQLMIGNEKFDEDINLAFLMFIDAITAIHNIGNYPVESELTRGFKEMGETCKAPFSLVFALQVSLDIIHILRADVVKGFDTMMKQMNTMASHVEAFLKFHKDCNKSTSLWPRDGVPFLESIAFGISEIRDDPVQGVRDKISGRLKCKPRNVRHRMLQLSPILSGLMLFKFRARMLQPWTGDGNNLRPVPDAAHLYNALTQEGLVTQRWMDMDMSMSMFTKKSVFVGDAPNNRTDYFTRYALQAGASAGLVRDLKKGGDIQKRLMSGGKKRTVKVELPVSSKFLTRYLDNRASMDWTTEDVEKIVGQSKHIQMDHIDGDLFSFYSEGLLPQDDPSAEAWFGSRGDLIRKLLIALQAETLEMAWPFLRMQEQSYKLLQCVQAHCAPILRDIFEGYETTRGGTDVCSVAIWVLMAASGSSLGFASDSDTRAMKAAAAAMEDFLEGANGEAVLRAERDMLGVQMNFDAPDSGKRDGFTFHLRLIEKK